jgi:hypothetical protein
MAHRYANGFAVHNVMTNGRWRVVVEDETRLIERRGAVMKNTAHSAR